MKILFVDFETYFNRKEGVCIKSAARKGLPMAAYIRDPRAFVHGMGYMWEGDQEAKWLSKSDIWPFIRATDWANTLVCAHNVKFDGSILAWKYGVKPGGWIDTKGMAKAVLGASVPGHSLAVLAAYFGLPPKGEMKTDGLSTLTPLEEAELAKYCLQDTLLCSQIYNRLKGDFPSSSYDLLDWSVRCFINPKLVADYSELKRVQEEESLRRNNLIEASGLDGDVLRSNEKFAKVLEAKGYEVPTKTSPRTGKAIPALSISDVEFIDMRDKGDELLQDLCEARVAAKSSLMETRTGLLAEVAKTGAWPFDVEFSGAVQTHRFSGAAGAGGNPQNFPKDGRIKSCIKAPDGYTLVVGDFAAIEMRVVAYLANDPILTRFIERGDDVYSDFSSKFYGRPISRADKAERHFGKTAILGLGYGMGAEKFKKTCDVSFRKEKTQLVVSEEDAERAVSLYRSTYASVPALWKYLHGHLEEIMDKKSGQLFRFLPYQNGEIILPSGLTLKYPGLTKVLREFYYTAYKAGRKERENIKIYGGKLLENISQALAGEICKEAIYALECRGWDVVGMVHDEIIMVVPIGQTIRAKQDLQRLMTKSPDWWPEIRLGAEIGDGLTWQTAK